MCVGERMVANAQVLCVRACWSYCGSGDLFILMYEMVSRLSKDLEIIVNGVST